MPAATRKQDTRNITKHKQIPNSPVHGTTITIHASDNNAGNSTNPTTSTHNGPIATQNVPNVAPATTAKSITTASPSAGTHTANTLTPHTAVTTPATSILPHLSLNAPTNGRPSAVPTFTIPVTSAARRTLIPIACAKSDKLKSNTIYSAQRPRQAEAVNKRLRRETEQHTTHPRPGGRDARRDGAARVEPLREDGDGGDVGEAYCEAEEEALGEVEMPGLGGEGGEEERGCLEEGAEEDEQAGAGVAG
ncbi:hypothetical protein V502_10054 [Pseudogymnoascus sp. VKM F-4520 (FW-2644)]|nr:hypothetical protein V502_10054 [Pseudogymnoascus sp. VKM F-4520 (FW-2644)]